MSALKITVYALTSAVALFLAALEMRIKRRLVDEFPNPPERVSGIGLLNDIRLRMQDERTLKTLPPAKLSNLRVVVAAKFRFVAALVLRS